MNFLKTMELYIRMASFVECELFFSEFSTLLGILASESGSSLCLCSHQALPQFLRL